MHFLLGNPEKHHFRKSENEELFENSNKRATIVNQYFNIWNFYLGVYFEEIFQQAT